MLDYKQLEKIQKKLQKKMTDKRFRHTIGVQYTCASLAMRYGTDLQQAALTGLLHDCAKYLEDSEMLSECKKHKISYSETEEKQAYLLHAKLGAFYAQKKYGIEEEEVLSAIRYHTTGRANMSLLEKIVFTADYIEPHRKMLSVLPEIRRMAFIDLDEAVYLILKATIDYLNTNPDNEKEIEVHTLEAYTFYQALHQKKKGI